jgi:glucan phosphorylase
LSDRPPYSFLATEMDGFSSLAELALDLRWSWNHGADGVWKQLDSALWELTSNPWVVLQTVSREKLQLLLGNPAFRHKIDALVQAQKRVASAPAWFQQNHPQAPLTCAAYFSMEFMLSEALPIYSGGLGNVAGDQLKAASDLGVPVVGVGLLYQQGYFRQVIDEEGAQQALYPYNDPGQLPITPLRQPNGEWLRLEIPLPGYSVWLRAWQVQIGRVKLYLLDSNDAANFPAHRGITSELYGGGPELRLKQELLLGIGGWRLLAALGIQPEICHLNEGHAAFAVLERARSLMAETGQPFEVALTVTRAGNLFTNQEHGDDPKWDAAEAEALYDLLEGKVIPEFYARDGQGVPAAWVARMRESMAQLTPRFSASRAVREYTEQHYLPGAASYRQRAENKGAVGRQMVDWRHTLEEKRTTPRFGEVKIESDGGQNMFEVQVYLDDLDPNAVRVELYADAINGGKPLLKEMTCVRQLPGTSSGYAYRAQVAASRPAADFTARVIPRREGVAVPLEAAGILWER